LPITPFHFGPGAALHALAPRQVSFLAFCASNVLIDLESLYNLLTGSHPVHQFLHTYLGATLAALVTVVLFRVAQRLAARWRWMPNLFEWRELALKPLVIGALLGAASHVMLDSVMHRDMAPFAPFSAANPLLGIVSLSTLHWFCLGCAVLALFIIGVRRRRRSSTSSC